MQKFFTYLKSILVILLFFGSAYFVKIPIWLFHIDVQQISGTMSVLLTLFSNLLLVLLLILIYRKDLAKEWKTFWKKPFENIDTGFKYWFVGLIVMVVSNLVINLFFTHDIATNEQTVQGMIDVAPWAMLLNAGIIAPFIEEVTFRKTFKDCIRNKWIFILSSGLFFGFLHVISFTSWQELLYIIPYSSLGISFALMYQKSDSVFTSTAMHVFHNTVLTLVSILPTLF